MLKVVGASWTTSRVWTLIIGAGVVVIFIFILNWELDRAEEDGNYSATVFWSEESGYRIDFWGQGNDLTQIPKGVVRAVLRVNIKRTGWAELELESQGEYSDEVQAFSAGYVEGSISWELIYQQWLNTVAEACIDREHYCQKVRDILRENSETVRETAVSKQDHDPFWHQVYLFYVQLDGIKIGWQSGMSRGRSEFKAVSIPDEDFLWMNVVSDLADFERVFNGSYEDTKSPLAFSALAGISSAFVKILPDKKDLFVAHNSAGLYRSMLKMLKRYQLRYHETSAPDSPIVPGRTVEFSSYPGAVHSQDDFYYISGRPRHHLAVVGSAINIDNSDLWKDITFQDQVLLGPRVMAANRLATTGKSWSHMLGRFNSGTGNKQWLVVDPSRLSHDVKKGLLLVVEQLPGHVHVSDHSHVLWSRGYFAANGIPYHQDILAASGNDVLEKRFGSEFSTQESALARIVHRDQENASDVQSIEQLMRSNDFIDDNTILLRPLGITDTKIISFHTSRSHPGHTRSHPITSQSGQTTYTSGPTFNDDMSYIGHIGHPSIWNFTSIQPSWAYN